MQIDLPTEKARKWLMMAKGPLLWIAIGMTLGLLGAWTHVADELRKLIVTFVVAMLFVGGVFIVQGVGFGKRNALAEFMELVGVFMRWVRGENPQVSPVVESIVRAMQAIAIRNLGTLLAAAIILHGVLDYMSHWE